MAVAYDGEANVTAGLNGVTSVTLSGKTTAGSNRCAIWHAGWGDDLSNITTITYAGTGMTSAVVVDGSGITGAIYRFLNPTTAGSDVAVSWGAAVYGACGCSSYNGVDQTTPVSGTANATNLSSTPATVNITSATGEVVVDGCGQAYATPTVGAGQTQVFNSDGGSGFYFGLGSREAGAATVTMSWTFSGNQGWVIVAASLKAAAEAGGATYPGWYGQRGGWW